MIRAMVMACVMLAGGAGTGVMVQNTEQVREQRNQCVEVCNEAHESQELMNQTQEEKQLQVNAELNGDLLHDRDRDRISQEVE